MINFDAVLLFFVFVYSFRSEEAMSFFRRSVYIGMVLSIVAFILIQTVYIPFEGHYLNYTFIPFSLEMLYKEHRKHQGRIYDFHLGRRRKRLCARTHITSGEPNSRSAGVQSLLKGLGSSRVVLMLSRAI